MVQFPRIRVKAFNLTSVMADRLKGGARNTCIEHTNSLSRHTSPSNEAGELLEQPVNLRIYLKLLVKCFFCMSEVIEDTCVVTFL